jgi:hypothetical protein
MRPFFAHAIVIAVTAAGLMPTASAQGGAAKENILKEKAIRQQKRKELKAQQQKMLPLPAPAVERFLQMSPEDRERALSRLAPERRQQVEDALGRLQQLSPDQLQRLHEVYPAFLNLRPARRQAVREELQELRKLKAAERKDRISSDARDFSTDELEILRQVTGVPDGQ